MIESVLNSQSRFLILAAAVLSLGVGLSGPVLLASPESNDSNPALVASPEPGWPQWRGPRRDGLCAETGLLQSWPENGPKRLWSATVLGQGYSAPIIVRDRIYVTGEADGSLHVFSFDLHGERVWQSANGIAWTGPYPGARASCTYSENRIYHMNGRGRVACLDAANGQELWALDMFERFGGKNLTWATSENLLVDGARLIITPGGTRALMAALDKNTGATVWTTPPLRLGPSSDPAQERLGTPVGETDNCSYGSPILLALHGRRMIVQSSLRHVFGVDAQTGQLLWTRPLPTRYSVIAATPVLVGDSVFVTAPDTEEGGKLFRLDWRSPQVRVETVWTTPLDTCHGGQVLVDGAIYGSWYRRGKGWACLDAKTGKVRAQLTDLAQGSVLYADGRLYCLSQEGDMALIKPGLKELEIVGRFRLVSERQSDVWTHPVVEGGRLYLRYHDVLSCFDVRKLAAPLNSLGR